MRTLLPFKCNKLFLLDDFAENHQGCYLVENNVELCTVSLLKKYTEELGVSRLFFIGSSKGGYSALNFSFLIPGVEVIIGAPQYFLGDYLDKDGTRCNLAFLLQSICTTENRENVGNVVSRGKVLLNNRLQNLIRSSEVKPIKVHLHYSKMEHTYSEHVLYMLSDLKESDVLVEEDVSEYPDHGGLSQYYPPFLVRTLKRVL